MNSWSPQPRVLDDWLSDALAHVPAVELRGARGVGKTTTAELHAATSFHLQLPTVLAAVKQDPDQLLRAERPVLIDEWQRYPETMNMVKFAVDNRAPAGSFILTGTPSAPQASDAHSGAGRVILNHMRPYSLMERKLDEPTVSLKRLFDTTPVDIMGETTANRDTYLKHLVRSGFPEVFHAPERFRTAYLEAYIQKIADIDMMTVSERKIAVTPDLLRRWMAAYARATSMDSKYVTIRDDAHIENGDPPSEETATGFRTALEKLGVIEDQPAWSHPLGLIKRCKTTSLRHLVDPGLAAALVNAFWLTEVEIGTDLGGLDVDRSFLGRLFQSLVVQSIRVYASVLSDAKVWWFGTRRVRSDSDQHEVDVIVTDRDGRVLAIEVKMADHVASQDCKHLNWLRAHLGPLWADGIVVYTGAKAYRRERDGIGVVPAALLGP